MVFKFGFIENTIDQCIYVKANGCKSIFLIVYLDYFLLTSNIMNLLEETRSFPYKNLEMEDLGEASFLTGIGIFLGSV